MDRVPNAQIRKMESDRIAKRIYARECAGSHSMSWLRKRWIDTVKEKGFGCQASNENVAG